MIYPMDLVRKNQAMAQPIRENLKMVWNMDTGYHLESMAKSHIKGTGQKVNLCLPEKRSKEINLTFKPKMSDYRHTLAHLQNACSYIGQLSGFPQ